MVVEGKVLELMILIEEYLKKFSFIILEKKLSTSDDDELNIDQCFKKDEKIIYKTLSELVKKRI